MVKEQNQGFSTGLRLVSAATENYQHAVAVKIKCKDAENH